MEVGGRSSIRVGPGIYRTSLLASAAACNNAIRRISDATSSGSSSGFSRLSSDRESHAPSDLFWLFYQEVLLTMLGSEESCGASNCSINNGHDDRDMDRLLRQLDVGWVLHAADADSDAGSSRQLRHRTATWLRALAEILHTYSYFRNNGATPAPAGNFFCVMHRRYWEEVSGTPDQQNFTRFAGTAISKMLPFVDSLVAPAPPRTATVDDGALPAQRLQALIQVRGALTRIRGIAELRPATSAEVASVHDELFSLLSAKLARLDEAVWNTMEEVRACVMSSTEEDDDGGGGSDSDSWGNHSVLHGSSHIHRMTRSVLNYINLLQTDYGSLHRIVYEAAKLRKCAPAIGSIGTLASLKLEMLSCLEGKLDEESQSFPNQSLRYLFLINNLYFVRQQFLPMPDMKFHMPVLATKIDNYIQIYLQVSWSPVLSCLHSPAPLCLGRYSSLPKFESEFHKVYSTQKLWKVPDPELRTRLRKAVIEKVNPSFTEYLQDSTVITEGITLTPQELEEMLQELFEG
ncbi:hypothetical protein SEVIR_4G244300v4 [Setaria viridis]|uniref:Exocyst subunit Exo70 family protein n=1 Tax=Setaria viridis TaxID=4556 RepID=A0A4U6V5E6_SETVI|nr:uncharacterized protein LOC117853290 [Setaria viridis]TKW22683.1 hypothetical protein SEVIR_4G244300v2 [Setaria viridis]